MEGRRVVVTGAGGICALGNGTGEIAAALRAGRPAIGPLTRLRDTGWLRWKNGAEIPGYDPGAIFSAAELRVLDPFSQYALIAAREAMAGARLELTPEMRAKCGVVVGNGSGGQTTQDEGNIRFLAEKNKRVNPLTIPRIMASAAGSHVAMEFGLNGPSYTVSSACSSSNHAIGQSYWMIRHGMMEAVVAGGTEAPLSDLCLIGWSALRGVMSSDTCRPFSKGRRGMILGEGAAMFVMESLDSAMARGATIRAEIVGFGMSSDARHITDSSPEGAAAAMRAALEDAGMPPEAIGYVNAHGTGTQMNDVSETRAIRDVFGGHADRLQVSSTKSLHGHGLGAAGALEGLATVLALEGGFLPPTANYVEPDPDCDLDVIPNEAREAVVEYALSNSFAFGGLNAVLVLRRWDR